MTMPIHELREQVIRMINESSLENADKARYRLTAMDTQSAETLQQIARDIKNVR